MYTIPEYGEKTNIITLDLELSNICQFNCPYCYVPKKPSKFLNKNDIDYIIKTINKSKTPILLQLVGGEPTMYPYINYIINNIKSQIVIVSNLERINKIDLNDNVKVHYSFHPTEEKRFEEKLQFLINHKDKVYYISIMAIKKHDDYCIDVYNKLKKYFSDKLEVIFPTVNGIEKIYDTALRESIHAQILDNKNFKGMKCYTSYYRITYKGDIYKGGCMLCGNISDKKLNFSIDPIICENDTCLYDCWIEQYKEC